MQDRRLSGRTVQYTHAVLQRALKQAVRWSMIPRNICEAVDVPQVRREEIQPLNAEQARRLLRTTSGERLEAFFVLAVHTGMRPGELLGLRWEDVTLGDTSGILQLNRALSAGELATPKTKGSRRRIKLSTGSARALKAHRKRQLEEMMQRPRLWQDHGLVFPLTSARPYPTVTSCARSRPSYAALACRHRFGSTTFGIPALPCCSLATSTPNTCRNF
jgi:integrase